MSGGGDRSGAVGLEGEIEDVKSPRVQHKTVCATAWAIVCFEVDLGDGIFQEAAFG
jgi:hypothetical protein